MSYDEWIAKVDTILVGLCSMKHDDLVDQSWWDWWNDGVTPTRAAKLCLNNQ